MSNCQKNRHLLNIGQILSHEIMGGSYMYNHDFVVLLYYPAQDLRYRCVHFDVEVVPSLVDEGLQGLTIVERHEAPLLLLQSMTSL